MEGTNFLCRICLKKETNELRFARKICKCSQENPVHFQCLQKWINKESLETNDSEEVKFIPQTNLKCDLCNETYPQLMKVGNKRQQILIEEYKSSSSFIQLEVYSEKGEHICKYIIAPKTLSSTYQIGRSESCHIILPDRTVSRLHSFLHYDNGEWSLFDAGSKFGTYFLMDEVEIQRECPSLQLSIDNSLL